jgi:hypothetical protein
MAIFCLWTLTNIAIKLSFGFFFLQIPTGKYQRLLCIGMMCFGTITNIEVIGWRLYTGFTCLGQDPPSIAFTGYKTVNDACRWTALTGPVQLYLQAATNILVDLTIALVPIPSIWGASFHWKTKLSVCAILFVSLV